MRIPIRQALCLALLFCAPFALAQTHFSNCLAPTGTNASIIVPTTSSITFYPRPSVSEPIQAGDEIAVFTPTGDCVGVATWNPEGVALAVWGDNPQTAQRDGLLVGDTLMYRAWDASSGQETPAYEIVYDARYDRSGRFSHDTAILAGALKFGRIPTNCVRDPRARGTAPRCHEAYTADEQEDQARPQGEEMDHHSGAAARHGEAFAFGLEPNYPNPFQSRTTLSYTVAEPGPVRLEIYDLLGRRIATLVDGDHAPGRYDATFDASDLGSGAYIARLVAGSQSAMQRLQAVR